MMINSCVIEYIDITSTYFDIEDSYVSDWMAELLSIEELYMPKVNKVMSKPRAMKIALDMYAMKKSEFSELYISSDALKLCNIFDYLGEPIFTNIDENLSGWLIFFDPSTFINWEHPCEYMFIVNSEQILMQQHNRSVHEVINMELI